MVRRAKGHDDSTDGGGVLVLTGTARESIEAVRQATGDSRVVSLAELTPRSCRDAALSVGAVEGIIGASPTENFAHFPSLRWVHSSAAGVDDWLEEDRLPPGVTLTSAAGNGAIPLAEHALMLMLMLNRDAPRWLRAQRIREWDRYTHGELAGLTVGIVGYGNSGRDLARKALACHMQVKALRREDVSASDGDVHVLHGEDGLRELLSTSDHVVVTAPLTSRTRGLIGARELAQMKEGSSLIVISRGGVVDEGALIDALRDGPLTGAGLDAHPIEPLPADSPLWDLPGVIVTPHNAATTHETAERGRQIMLGNAARWASGEPLRNVVDREAGY